MKIFGLQFIHYGACFFFADMISYGIMNLNWTVLLLGIVLYIGYERVVVLADF